MTLIQEAESNNLDSLDESYDLIISDGKYQVRDMLLLLLFVLGNDS
jgi:hypothetical protein